MEARENRRRAIKGLKTENVDALGEQRIHTFQEATTLVVFPPFLNYLRGLLLLPSPPAASPRASP